MDEPQTMKLREKEKMLAGELYRSTDPELQTEMAKAQQHLRRLNAIPNEAAEQRFEVLQGMLGRIGTGSQIKSPFSCDYGVHIRIGKNGFINYGCVFLDCNLIIIGDDAQIGPGVHIYTALHPVDPEIRSIVAMTRTICGPRTFLDRSQAKLRFRSGAPHLVECRALARDQPRWACRQLST